MSFADAAQGAVDAVFTTLGRSASFEALTSTLGQLPEIFATPVAVTVVPTTRDREIGGFNSTQLIAFEKLVELRVSEVAAPKIKDRLMVDSVPYRIGADPKRLDRFGLVWTIGLKKER